MNRALLAGLTVAILSIHGAVLAAGGVGGVRSAVVGERKLSFEVPADFCPVEPGRGGVHVELWRRFTPPPQRKAALLALDVDCATVRAADAGRLQRPARMTQLVDSPASADISGPLASALDVLEQRYARLARERGTPVPRRDRLAVYVEQHGRERNGGSGLVGISAFTVVSGRPLIFTVIDFSGRAAVPELSESAARAIGGLHAEGR